MHWSLKSFSAAYDPSRCRQAISAKRRWQLKTKIYNYVLNRILTKLTALHEIHITKKRRSFDRRLVLALSIFPGRCQPSIVDRNELNYRVRNGNGWTLILISTNYCHLVFQINKHYKLVFAPCQYLLGHRPFRTGDPYRIRTDVNGVRGRCLNHLTNGPWCTFTDSNRGPTD